MKCCANPYCDSVDERITDHHLYPKGFRHKRTFPNKGAIPERQERMKLCRSCHTVLHKAKTNMQLALYYNTKEKVIEFFVKELKYGALAELAMHFPCTEDHRGSSPLRSTLMI